ncbi:MAG: TldD/PmbA family protein [Clostridia bacterium]|nr:TldD/PmbA family protein [Clostridia bacterium]
MQFEILKDALVKAALEAGLTEYEIYYMEESSLSAETLGRELHNQSSSTTDGISFRCICNGKMGYAATELLTPEEMAGLVETAKSNALCIESDDPVMIFRGSDRYAKLPESDYALPTMASLRQNALDLSGRIFDKQSGLPEGMTVDNATAGFSFGYLVNVRLFNSYGLDLSNRYGMTQGGAEAVVQLGEEKESGWKVGLLDNASSIESIASEALRKAKGKMQPKLVESGPCPVVFAPDAVKSILATFIGSFSAKEAQLGLSKLAGKEGTEIAAKCFSLIDDPMYEKNPAKTAFDGEGVATRRKYLVRDGVMETLMYDLTTAAKAGKASTGNGKRSSYNSTVQIGPYTLIVEPGNRSLDSILSSAGSGVYVDTVKGLHAGADPVSGDFSIESAGFRIENGRLGGPIHSFTIAGNFFDLLKNIREISDTLDFTPSGLSGVASPAVWVEGLSIAGK